MAPAGRKPSLLAIVGPTASGKSGLAMKIAQAHNGEIISADSRTIYKGMDIGTAKPSHEEQTRVPHWGLDLIEPGQSFSSAQFKDYALEKIDEIQQRGKLPTLVGGTGLYIDAVIFDFKFGPKADTSQRKKLERLNIDQLQAIINKKNYPMPTNRLNKRHLIRAVERQGVPSRKKRLHPGTIVIGLDPGSEKLRENIGKRVEQMFENGLVEEVKGLIDDYGEQNIVRTGGIGYSPVIEYLKGAISLDEAKDMFRKGDWQYARRQRTWFRRNKNIQWFDNSAQALSSVNNLLNN